MGWKNGRALATATAAVAATLLVIQFATAEAAPVPTPGASPSASTSPSAAAKPTTAADAAAQVKKLEDEAAEIGEAYDAAQDALDAGNERLKVLQDDIALQQKKVDQLSAQAQAIALAQFRSRDIDTTVQIFTSGDPETMMAKLSTVNKVDEDMDAILADQQAEQANLTDMRRAAEAEVAALADQEQKMAELKKQIDDKLAAAKQLYNTLSAEEQARMNDSDGGPVTVDPGDYADASARIQASYRAAGVRLPHSSQAQSLIGRSVSKSELKPGDLIFFYHPIHHVGMYIGGGKFVHARNTRADLVVQSLASYPAPWAGARRVLN